MAECVLSQSANQIENEIGVRIFRVGAVRHLAGDLEEAVDIPLPERGHKFVFGREIQIKSSARNPGLFGDVADTSSSDIFLKLKACKLW